MTTTLPPHLRPSTRGMAREYWRGAARGELRLPRCRDCATFVWPPRVRCPICGCSAFDWIASSGRGIVHTFTIVRQATEPHFRTKVPYAVAMVEVDEGPRLMTHIVGCRVDDIRIGMRVGVAFVDLGDGLALPVFEPLDPPIR
jgi:uncharacterized OB-fold protein